MVIFIFDLLANILRISLIVRSIWFCFINVYSPRLRFQMWSQVSERCRFRYSRVVKKRALTFSWGESYVHWFGLVTFDFPFTSSEAGLDGREDAVCRSSWLAIIVVSLANVSDIVFNVGRSEAYKRYNLENDVILIKIIWIKKIFSVD